MNAINYPILGLHNRLQQALQEAVGHMGSEVTPVIERPKEVGLGEFSSPVALQLAKILKKPAPALAEEIIKALPILPEVAQVKAAGPYINFSLKPAALQSVVAAVIGQGERFGASCKKPGRVLLEFVSANPTGPLHVGHGRGAAIGASLASIMKFAGLDVHTEYYVNDAGRQMDVVALSTWLRYLERASALPADFVFPAKAYQGDYVRAMSESLQASKGLDFVRPLLLEGLPSDGEEELDWLVLQSKNLLGNRWQDLLEYVLSIQLGDCREDLMEFGVVFDEWYSERSLFSRNEVAVAVAELEGRGHTFVLDDALWFRSTDFGDDKDRVLKRQNGQFTYFASDLAYHREKFRRGFDVCINIWGADHHGYMQRIKGGLTAMGLDAARLEISLVQFAVLYRGEEKVSMSTRGGEYVTLRELRGEVGNEAARFFYVLRKSDQHLDFDLSLAVSQSNDNPVHYVGYAHARLMSVFRQEGVTEKPFEVSGLQEPQELELCRTLLEFPQVVTRAAQERAPHGVAFYLQQLAAQLHRYYNAQRILVDDVKVRQSRLSLCRAVAQVLKNGLNLLGVAAPDSM